MKENSLGKPVGDPVMAPRSIRLWAHSWWGGGLCTRGALGAQPEGPSRTGQQPAPAQESGGQHDHQALGHRRGAPATGRAPKDRASMLCTLKSARWVSRRMSRDGLAWGCAFDLESKIDCEQFSGKNGNGSTPLTQMRSFRI